MAPKWFFPVKHKSDINCDPIESEFFANESFDAMTDALVRESIQNSLDASTGDGPVQVRFTFSSSENHETCRSQRNYFFSLWPHIESKKSGLDELPHPNEMLSYLIIEDFGTRGLNGDIGQYEDRGLKFQVPHVGR